MKTYELSVDYIESGFYAGDSLLLFGRAILKDADMLLIENNKVCAWIKARGDYEAEVSLIDENGNIKVSLWCEGGIDEAKSIALNNI